MKKQVTRLERIIFPRIDVPSLSGTTEQRKAYLRIMFMGIQMVRPSRLTLTPIV